MAREWWDVCRRVLAEIRTDQLPLIAGGIAFFGLLSLVPGLIALLTIYALVADTEHVREQLQPLLSALPSSAGELVRHQLESAAHLGSRGLTLGLLVSVLAVLWSTSAAMRAVVSGITRAYDQEETRGWLRLRGLAFLLALGALIVVATALGALAVLPIVLDALALPGGTRWVVGAVRWVGLVILVGAGLAVLYRFGCPHHDRRGHRWISPGIVAALGLWIAGSAGFSRYVDGFANYHGTYGTLAGIVVLLLWLYLTSFAVLVGAEIDAELTRRRAGPSAGAEHASSCPPSGPGSSAAPAPAKSHTIATNS